MGHGHFEESLVCGRSASEAQRVDHLELLDIQSLCAARGISYEPTVFTAQGGIERHSEALLSRIAGAVSKEEGSSLAEAKSEIIQATSLTLALSAGKAVIRRRPAPVAVSANLHRALQETCLLEADDDADITM